MKVFGSFELRPICEGTLIFHKIYVAVSDTVVKITEMISH